MPRHLCLELAPSQEHALGRERVDASSVGRRTIDIDDIELLDLGLRHTEAIEVQGPARDAAGLELQHTIDERRIVAQERVDARRIFDGEDVHPAHVVIMVAERTVGDQQAGRVGAAHVCEVLGEILLPERDVGAPRRTIDQVEHVNGS
jgi:hypothetical protein